MFNILHEIHNDLAFLPERMKTEKVEKLAENFLDKEYVIYINKILKSSKSWIDIEKST